VFDFNSVADSSSGANRDVVLDFNSAAGDTLNLASIDANTAAAGNQAFAFIGTAAFSNTAGELRFTSVGANGYLSGDVDGDGISDLTIQLNGVLSLTAGDIVA
jgi:uncharacterized phosphosugar-binding protein